MKKIMDPFRKVLWIQPNPTKWNSRGFVSEVRVCPIKGARSRLAQGDWVRTRLKKGWKSFFKISAIGVELKAICSILSNRGVELLQSFSSFKGIYQTLFWRSYFYLSLDFSVIIPMSSSSGGGRGGRRANSGRQILTPDKLFLRKKMRESKFKRIRVSKDNSFNVGHA